MKTSVSHFMSVRPHTIGRHQTMAAAHQIMRDYHLRHLPVLDGGQLVGIVTERDLHLVETLHDVDPRRVLVEEAMTADPYVVSPETPIHEVASTMAEHRYGCAVVVEHGQVVGMFTTTDALYALTALAPKR